VRRDGALDGGISNVFLRRHLRRVNEAGCQGEPALPMGVNRVLMFPLDKVSALVLPGVESYLVEFLDFGADHHHHVTVLHGDFEALHVTFFATIHVLRVPETRFALPAEAHGGRRAQREGSHNRTQLAFTIVMVLLES
jgi:hypothetical protein